jgi:hypothetical protein
MLITGNEVSNKWETMRGGKTLIILHFVSTNGINCDLDTALLACGYLHLCTDPFFYHFLNVLVFQTFQAFLKVYEYIHPLNQSLCVSDCPTRKEGSGATAVI